MSTHRRGNALLMALIFLVAISALAISTITISRTAVRSSRTRVVTQQAVQAAESGIEKAVWCLNNPTGGCPGGSSFTGESNVTVGNATYTTSVSTSGSTATVTSTSTIAGPTGTITKQVQAKLSIAASVTPAFQFGVQTGIGGVSMSNNAHIDGNIYTSGSVSGDNGSYITGDAILTPSPANLDSISNPTVSPSPSTITLGSNGSTNDVIAQSFVPTITERVFSVDLKLAKVSSPTSTVKIQIYSDGGTHPGSDLTGGGQTITSTTPNSTDPNWWGTSNGNGTGWTTQTFNPSTNPILDAGTTYWLVLTTSSTNSSKYWTVVTGADTTYTSGTAKIGGSTSSMSTACASACDLAFRVTLGGINPTLSAPSVQGDAYAYTIDSTTVGKKAYYQALSGTVKANNGAVTCTSVGNAPYCNLVSSNQPTVDFPISDSEIAAFEGQATQGGVQSTNCSIPDGSTIGPKEYDCDVTINGTVTLNGTIWINGDLTLINSAILKLSTAYGSGSGVVVVDEVANRAAGGRVNLSNNANLQGNGTAGTYIMLIGMHDDPSGATTAIDVSNNLTAGVLYAPLGAVAISNNAGLKEVTAYKLSLSNNASVQYETGLASAIFTSGPGGAWTYKKGSYQILQ